MALYEDNRDLDGVRVVIVGCGLAGLQCASSLVRKYGLSKDQIVLLEASHRIGGRVKVDTSFVEGFSVSSLSVFPLKCQAPVDEARVTQNASSTLFRRNNLTLLSTFRPCSLFPVLAYRTRKVEHTVLLVEL